MRLPSFGLMIMLLVACGPSPKTVTEKPATPEEGVNNALNRYVLEKADPGLWATLKNPDGLVEFYGEEPIQHWGEGFEVFEATDSVIDIFSKAADYGLDSSIYHFPRLRWERDSVGMADSLFQPYEAMARMELRLTDAWLSFARHLNEGILDSVTEEVYPIERNRLDTNLASVLHEALVTDKVVSTLLSFQPEHPEYHRLQQSVAKYLVDNRLSKDSVFVPNFKEDSSLAYAQARKVLMNLGYLDTVTVKQDTSVTKAIKKFQRSHGLWHDGLIGKNTARAMSQSSWTRYQRAAASLERWRWKKDWPDRHILVLVPTYKLKVFDDGRLIREHKVVVGNPKARTPEVNSLMKHMITMPYWHVPEGIAKKEILPKIKRDSTYLDRNGYEIMSHNYRVVDHTSIDWKKMGRNHFPYKIRQKGGGGNALGVIKFIFPNEHFVYLHDTPSKQYFNNEIRAYSHGCIRLHNPLDMAEYLLERDSNEANIDTVNALIERQEMKRIKLKEPLSTHLHYITCVGDEEGNLIFFPDVYESDRALIRLMFPEENMVADNE